jgi:hypothetical protein
MMLGRSRCSSFDRTLNRPLCNGILMVSKCGTAKKVLRRHTRAQVEFNKRPTQYHRRIKPALFHLLRTIALQRIGVARPFSWEATRPSSTTGCPLVENLVIRSQLQTRTHQRQWVQPCQHLSNLIRETRHHIRSLGFNICYSQRVTNGKNENVNQSSPSAKDSSNINSGNVQNISRRRPRCPPQSTTHAATNQQGMSPRNGANNDITKYSPASTAYKKMQPKTNKEAPDINTQARARIRAAPGCRRNN